MELAGRTLTAAWTPLLIVLGFFLCMLAPPAAKAAAPEFLLRIPEATGSGAGAGQLNHPRGVAVNPDAGRIYVGEYANARVSEYTAWGLFVRAWGWDVAPDGAPGDTPSDEFEICGPAEPESTPSSGLCQAGDPGSESGQFERPVGLAIDGSGNVYVFDHQNLRIQKFSPAGEFLLMFGGEVNRTKVEAGAPAPDRNVCPVDPGDACKAGAEGESPSHLESIIGDVVAYSPTADAIVAGDEGRIQVFDLSGAYREEIPFEGPLATFAGETVRALEVDLAGNIYFALSGEEDIFKLDEAGEPVAPGQPGKSSFDVENPLGVAVDADGNVYTAEIEVLSLVGRYVLGFDSDGAPIDGLRPDDEFATFGDDITTVAANQCEGSEGSNLYVAHMDVGFGSSGSRIDAYGPAPAGCEAPPKRPPEIVDQFAIAVGDEDATVRALVNPRFWTDTAYHVEYGTGKCSAGGCPNKAPLLPSRLTEQVINRALPTVGVVLDELVPGATHYFRFVAESSGGGPVYGIDSDGTGPEKADPLHGLEGSFKARAPKDRGPACPNDAFRIGPVAALPDCRAYEMVSPLDKENGDVALWISRNALSARFVEVNQAAVSSDRFTYTSATAFAAPGSAPFVSQYLASRDSGGWGASSITAPRTESPVSAIQTFGNDYSGFSADLCKGWFRHFSVAPLAAGAVEGYANLYERDNCGVGGYEPLTTEPPQHDPAEYSDLSVKGASVDGSHVIFTVDGKIHPAAPDLEPEELLLYEHTTEGLRFVCILPSGKASSGACSAGTLAGAGVSDISSLHNAISADGSHLFWTAYSGKTTSGPDHPGEIYLRIDGEKTVRVSGSVAPSPAFFWSASSDGSKAIFEFVSAGSFQDQLYEFDVSTQTSKLIAGGVEGPMGASEDASRIYFASTEDLDGSGPASASAHNLYLYDANSEGGAGSFTFIMALAEEDISSVSSPIGRFTAINAAPGTRSAQVSPDGLHATFTSVASPTPTGYDNRDAESGQASQEVYRYDAGSKDLRCVSCNATGARPAAENVGGSSVPLFVAARIQGWEARLHAPRVLSDDGSRVFFESHEALAPGDTNGTWDVYQWEEPGKGICTTARSTFSDVTGGCVDLISSGHSSVVSTFLDADPRGESIFFSTQSSLVGRDYGLNDVYVARVGGGFPEPVEVSPCEGESCQSPPSPPAIVSPSSRSFRAAAKPRRCPRGKRRVVRKGKVRCVAKRRHGRERKRRKAAGRRGGRG